MCLYIDQVKTEKAKADTGFRIYYKQLRKCNGRVFPPLHRGYTYKPGFNKADYTDSIYTGIVNHAIHVYTSLEAAKETIVAGETIVSVKCYNKDLIAIGCNANAAYRKVWLSRAEYDKVKELE